MMSASTTDPATMTTEPQPSNVQITIRDDLTDPELRQAAERSVDTLAARSAEAFAQARTADEEQAKLTETLHAPLLKVIEKDQEAGKALQELRTRDMLSLDSPSSLHSDTQEITTRDVVPLTDLQGAREIRVPPYDFSWSWHHGKAPFSSLHGKTAT